MINATYEAFCAAANNVGAEVEHCYTEEFNNSENKCDEVLSYVNAGGCYRKTWIYWRGYAYLSSLGEFVEELEKSGKHKFI